MKKILVIVSAVVFAGLAQASELWWTVADTVTVDGTAGQTWTTAKLMANTGIWKYGTNEGGTLVGAVSADDMSGIGFVTTELGAYGNSAYSFYVELYNGNDFVGKSYVNTEKGSEQGGRTYAELVASRAIDSGDVFNPGVSSAYDGFNQFTTSDVIPEPTSGVLMALGMMFFGLKRKRV